jgi:hypothetical protein
VRNIRNYYDILVWLEDGPEDYQEPGQPGNPPVTADRGSTGRSGFSRDTDSLTDSKSRG